MLNYHHRLWLKSLLYFLISRGMSKEFMAWFSMQRKWCPIAWGWWILLLGWWILFLTCPMGKWFFWENSNYRGTVINPARQFFFRLAKTTFRLVHARYSLPKWQAVKLTFFAPRDWLSASQADNNANMEWSLKKLSETVNKIWFFFSSENF